MNLVLVIILMFFSYQISAARTVVYPPTVQYVQPAYAVPQATQSYAEQQRIKQEYEKEKRKADKIKSAEKLQKNLDSKGKTLAKFIVRVLEASKTDFIKAKTRTEFANSLGNMLSTMVGELDYTHPLHKELSNIKNAFIAETDKEKVSFSKHFAKVALEGDLIQKYNDGIRISATPTAKQLQTIGADDRYWPYYNMYVLQELEKTEETCEAGRKTCLDYINKRARQLAESVGSRDENATNANVLSHKIDGLVGETIRSSQTLTKEEKAKLYGVAVRAVKSHLAHGSQSAFNKALQESFKQNPDLNKLYTSFIQDESVEHDELSIFKRKSFMTPSPWPKVLTPEQEAKKKKKEEEAKRKEKEKKKMKENKPESKANEFTKKIQEKGFGVLEKALGGLFG